MSESRPTTVQIPVEVAAEAVVFAVVARGYDRAQVRARVVELEQELAELRWQLADVAAQRQALEEQRERQERWAPSLGALGVRAEEILRLADEEAAELRARAREQVRRWERGAAAELEARKREHAEVLEQARADGERELRRLESSASTRRELLDGELARTRRDAELEVAGLLAQATAQAQDVRAAAAREADERRAQTQAEVERLQRRRAELARELTELSDALLAVLARIGRDDPPLEVRTSG